MGERSRASLTARRAWRLARLLLAVTLITAMLWVYAEGEIVRPHELTLNLQFVEPRGTHLVIEPTGTVAARVAFRCAASRLAEVQRLAESGPIALEVAEPQTQNHPRAEVQSVVLKERLANDPRLAALGINIDAVTPAVVQVQVERLRALRLAVRLDAGGAEIAGPVVIEPPTVSVRVPASRATELDEVAVLARPGASRLGQLATDHPQTLEGVPLSLPEPFADLSDAIEPRTVNVSLTLRRASASVTLPSIPITIELPAGLHVHYTIAAAEQAVPDVRLSGPRETIERLRRGELHLRAQLALSAEELQRLADGEPATRALIIIAPPGTPPLSVDSLPPTLTFRVLRRSAE